MFSSTRSLAVMALAKMVAGAGEEAPASTNSTGATGAAAAAKAAAAKAAINAAVLNQDFYNYIFVVCGSLIAALLVWRVGLESVKYVRQLTCLNNETQLYFTRPSDRFASIKKHFLYAPIFSKRHNREIQLSSAINVGTLPTRFQLLFLVGYFATNVAFCVVNIQWNGPAATAARELRNRTGILAVVNMVGQGQNVCHVNMVLT